MSNNKGGRPKIEITERDKQQIEIMAGLGMTLDKIALILDISPRTLDKWVADPAVNALYKKGKAKAEATISQSLFEKAKGGDLPSIVWYEKTRCGRSDRAEVKHTGDAESPVRIFLPDNGRNSKPLKGR